MRRVQRASCGGGTGAFSLSGHQTQRVPLTGVGTGAEYAGGEGMLKST